MEPGASNTDSLVTVLIQELDNCNGLLEVGLQLFPCEAPWVTVALCLVFSYDLVFDDLVGTHELLVDTARDLIRRNFPRFSFLFR